MQNQYHLGKANVVADTLSKKAQRSLNAILITQPDFLRDLKNMSIEFVLYEQANELLSVLEV